MSWHFSRELVAAFSAANCWDGGPCAGWRSTPPPAAYSSHGKTTTPYRLSRSGMTSEPLTDANGAALLTWFREVSLARTSALQDAEPESKASAPASGWKWPESFVKYDPDSRSWRTRQYSLLGGSESFSETWPTWGSMRDGECSALAPSVPHTHEKGCSSWPTPVARDARSFRGAARPAGAMGTEPLCVEVSRREGVEDGGLNPSWVEWLMGWPVGWTEYAPLAMDRFQAWRQWHGEPCGKSD
jgi:hypothetical protein